MRHVAARLVVVRSAWAQEAVAAGQSLAPFDLAVSMWAQMAGLVARIPFPESPSERTLAGLVVTRAGWEILRAQADRGLKTASTVLTDSNTLLEIVDTGPWTELASRLRAVDDPVEPRARTVVAREFLDSRFTARVTLADVARAAGSSVRLLTDQFSRRYP